MRKSEGAKERGRAADLEATRRLNEALKNVHAGTAGREPGVHRAGVEVPAGAVLAAAEHVVLVDLAIEKTNAKVRAPLLHGVHGAFVHEHR